MRNANRIPVLFILLLPPPVKRGPEPIQVYCNISKMKKNVIIIGAGASGLMCAIEAAKRGRSVLIMDHMPRIGSKIRISGGGKCNFSNRHISSDNYLSRNRHFCKSALSRFAPGDIIRLLIEYRIPFEEKEHGRLFCAVSSGRVVDMLHREYKKAGVESILNSTVQEVRRIDMFQVTTDHGTFASDALVIATGGLSYQNLGASDLGHRIAKQFGMQITPVRPALVPLTLSRQESAFFKDLSGVSFEAIVTCGRESFKEEVLVTHHGLSGPGILQVSSYWERGSDIHINILPDQNIDELLTAHRYERIELKNFLARYLPRRLAAAWCTRFRMSKPLCQYSDKELRGIAAALRNWELKPSGTEGYKSAEVTLGGVDTHELSSRNMESKRVPGLYFIGEVVDVTGQLGGYNLHWAWASGYTAGQFV